MKDYNFIITEIICDIINISFLQSFVQSCNSDLWRNSLGEIWSCVSYHCEARWLQGPTSIQFWPIRCEEMLRCTNRRTGMCKVQRYTLHNLAHQDNTNIGPRGWQPGDQADTGKPGRLQALLCLASQAGICKLCWLPPPACHPLPLGTAGLWSSSHFILVHLQIFFILIWHLS